MRIMPNSVVTKTRQSWKFVVGEITTVIGAVALVLGLGHGRPVVALGGLLVGLLSTITTWLSIRCPKCRAPWLWMAVSTQKHLQWLDWLYEQKVCPKCGHDPAVPKEPMEAR
jgi:hypothetical protein